MPEHLLVFEVEFIAYYGRLRFWTAAEELRFSPRKSPLALRSRRLGIGALSASGWVGAVLVPFGASGAGRRPCPLRLPRQGPVSGVSPGGLSGPSTTDGLPSVFGWERLIAARP